MERNLLTTVLKKIDMKNDIKVFVFGSILNSQQVNDIDILIVYGPKYSVEEAIALRQNLYKSIIFLYNISIDISLLSVHEKEYTFFISEEKAVLIYPAANESEQPCTGFGGSTLLMSKDIQVAEEIP